MIINNITLILNKVNQYMFSSFLPIRDILNNLMRH